MNPYHVLTLQHGLYNTFITEAMIPITRAIPEDIYKVKELKDYIERLIKYSYDHYEAKYRVMTILYIILKSFYTFRNDKNTAIFLPNTVLVIPTNKIPITPLITEYQETETWFRCFANCYAYEYLLAAKIIYDGRFFNSNLFRCMLCGYSPKELANIGVCMKTKTKSIIKVYENSPRFVWFINPTINRYSKITKYDTAIEIRDITKSHHMPYSYHVGSEIHRLIESNLNLYNLRTYSEDLL